MELGETTSWSGDFLFLSLKDPAACHPIQMPVVQDEQFDRIGLRFKPVLLKPVINVSQNIVVSQEWSEQVYKVVMV